MASSFFLERKMDPVRQAAIFCGSALLFMLLTLALNQTGWYEVDLLFPWSIATAFLLLFAVFNSLMSFNAENSMRYWGRSVYCFMASALVNGTAAWLISGVPIGAAQSYRWIYLVVTVGFLVFLTVVNLMKKIVQFAEKEEWHQPRQRK